MIGFGHLASPRRCGVLTSIAVALVLVPAARVSATDAQPEPRASFAIDFAGPDVPAWQAEAVARTAELDLDGDRLRAIPGAAAIVAAARCAAGDTTCAVAAYRAAGVDLAIRGRLFSDRVEVDILPTWPGASPPVWRGSVPLRGRSRQALAEALRAALHPVTRPGGALDSRGSRAPSEQPAAWSMPAADGVALAALAAALLLILPLALGAILLGRRNLGKLVRTRALRRSLAALAALGVGVYGLQATEHAGEWSWAVFLAGGLAWGAFAAAMLPILFPPLHGLGRVEHTELLRVLEAWCLLALRRWILVALVGAPFALALWAACDALDLPAMIGIGVVAPLWGLWLRLALQSAVEVLSLRLDDDLIDGDAAAQGDWHDAIRGYYMGYVRRAGLSASARVLDGGVHFLPGRGDEIHLYGGGLTRSRLVIGRELLELALAPYGRPHDYAEPRVSKLHWTEWNAGLVVPIRRDLPVATPEERKPTMTAADGELERQPLGEPRTLAGIVEPSAVDPRHAHRPWEDSLWLDWDPGEEHDGTDASDKDFLFGLLVHGLGRIERHEDRGATLAIAGRRWIASWPAFARRLIGAAPLGWLRQPAAGDAGAALNAARHHLVQHLGFRLWRQHELLTARAHVPELERCSGEIMRTLDTTTPLPAREAAALRRRLRWLAAFVDGRGPIRSTRRWRRAALAGAALALAAIIALAARESIDYHDTYLQRTGERPPDHEQAQ
jgi:hypothetical protein